jgi:hypothetical protein
VLASLAGFGCIELTDQADKPMRQFLWHRITLPKLLPDALSGKLPGKQVVMRAMCHRAPNFTPPHLG